MISKNIGAAAATPAAPVPTPMQFYAVFLKSVMWTIHAARWSTNAACNTDPGLGCWQISHRGLYEFGHVEAK